MVGMFFSRRLFSSSSLAMWSISVLPCNFTRILPLSVHTDFSPGIFSMHSFNSALFIGVRNSVITIPVSFRARFFLNTRSFTLSLSNLTSSGLGLLELRGLLGLLIWGSRILLTFTMLFFTNSVCVASRRILSVHSLMKASSSLDAGARLFTTIQEFLLHCSRSSMLALDVLISCLSSLTSFSAVCALCNNADLSLFRSSILWFRLKNSFLYSSFNVSICSS